MNAERIKRVAHDLSVCCSGARELLASAGVGVVVAGKQDATAEVMERVQPFAIISMV